MRRLYSLLLYLALPAVLAYLAYRGLRDRGYMDRWSERFGRAAAPPRPGGILLHAVSMGEVNAASPLVREILQRFADHPLYVTAFTPTGSERVRTLFGDRVFHAYAPLDLPGPVRRFFDRLQPCLLLVMETEIWPNLFHEARRRGIPIVIANARMTERSLRGYRRVRTLVAQTLSAVTTALAQTEADAGRLVDAGVPRDRVVVAGNLKFDLRMPPGLLEQGEAVRRAWGVHRPSLVAGSTHETDEQALLTAFGRLLADFPDALLVLAPRHPERFGRAAQAARTAGLRVALRSEHPACPADCSCWVVDTVGELLTYYAAGDIAFVGGTLEPLGGHNVIEPASLGRPVLLGPHTQNVREIAGDLVARGGATVVRDATELETAIRSLFGDPDLRDRMGRAAQGLVRESQGALDRTLAVVESALSRAAG